MSKEFKHVTMQYLLLQDFPKTRIVYLHIRLEGRQRYIQCGDPALE